VSHLADLWHAAVEIAPKAGTLAALLAVGLIYTRRSERRIREANARRLFAGATTLTHGYQRASATRIASSRSSEVAREVEAGSDSRSASRTSQSIGAPRAAISESQLRAAALRVAEHRGDLDYLTPQGGRRTAPNNGLQENARQSV